MIPCQQESTFKNIEKTLDRLETKLDLVGTDINDLKGFKFKVIGAFSVITVLVAAGWQIFLRYL
jgi:hypothetical protein